MEKLQDSQIMDLVHQIWEIYDIDKSGKLEYTELQKFFKSLSIINNDWGFYKDMD